MIAFFVGRICFGMFGEQLQVTLVPKMPRCTEKKSWRLEGQKLRVVTFCFIGKIIQDKDHVAWLLGCFHMHA